MDRRSLSSLRLRVAGAALTGLALAWLVPTTALAAGDAAKGKTVYTTNCESCHGPAGKGDGPVGAALDPKPRDFSTAQFKFDTDKDGKPGSDADLTNVVKDGAGKYGGNALMAPWGGILSEADIANVVAYVRSLKK
jgi:mono/diheme cytochrome c family protein